MQRGETMALVNVQEQTDYAALQTSLEGEIDKVWNGPPRPPILDCALIYLRRLRFTHMHEWWLI